MAAIIESGKFEDLGGDRDCQPEAPAAEVDEAVEIEPIKFASLEERDAYSYALRQLVGRMVVVSAKETHRLTEKGSIHTKPLGRTIVEAEVEIIEVMGMLGSYVHYQLGGEEGERRTSFVSKFVAPDVIQAVRAELADNNASTSGGKTEFLYEGKSKRGLRKRRKTT